jgi:hypothetical protein
VAFPVPIPVNNFAENESGPHDSWDRQHVGYQNGGDETVNRRKQGEMLQKSPSIQDKCNPDQDHEAVPDPPHFFPRA